MSNDLPPSTPQPLDYQKPPRKPESTGCLVVSSLLGVLVAGGAIFMLWAMLTSQAYGFAAGGAGGTVILVFVAVIVTKRFGISIALAITLTSVCAALLLFGLCTGMVVKGGI